MFGPLIGKRALITGAATGIGRMTAAMLAERGAQVVLNCKDEHQREGCETTASAIRAVGGLAHCIVADVSNVAAIHALFAESIALMGGLDIVISNAAGDAVIRPVAETSEDDYDRAMALNARSQFFVMQEAARRVEKGGQIVILSSSTVALTYPGSASYAGAKRAAELYAQVLAIELGPRNITVNVVAPGPTNTSAMRAQNPAERIAHLAAITPLGRLGEPHDIASVIAFLASDESRWITRQVLQVGGGIV